VDFVKNLLCEEFLEPGEVCINMWLILQNMTDFTVTALAAQNTREHPNRVKGFVESEMEAHILPNSDKNTSIHNLPSHIDFIYSSYCSKTLYFISHF